MISHKASVNHQHRTLQTGILLCCGTLAFSAFASGFRLPEVSVTGTALSNALVANPDLPGALPYNPAIMAFQKKGQVIAGMVFVRPDISVKPAAGTAADSEGESTIPVPNAFVTNHINKDWSWGVGINAPFGLETKWKDETFATFAGSADPLEPEHSRIEMLNFNPNVAYQLNNNTSIALGIDNYRVRELIFNTQAIKIKGDGQDYGWNIGLLHTEAKWDVGLSYRSSVTVDLEGTVDGTLVGSNASAAKASIEFPSLLQIGGRYKVDNKLAVELDVERTGWSSFDTIEIVHSSPGLSNPIISTNKWKNATAYRLGATYEFSPVDQLRLGYSYDETPIDDNFFSARIPGNDRQTLSFGLAHELADWTMEFAYMYVKADERKINSSTSFLAGLPGNTDPNGTDAYNGTYKLTAHLFGVGVSTQF